MLTETEAYVLLEQHCGGLPESSEPSWVGIHFDRRSEWIKNGCSQVDLVARRSWPPAESERDTADGKLGGRDMGARLRLALDVVQAIGHCRGFEPAMHQRFWQRVVETLWLDPQHHRRIDAVALSPTAFDHVKMGWHARSFYDEAFWIGFLHGTPECDAALCAVLETLSSYQSIGQPPRPLRVSLAHGSQGKRVERHDDGAQRSLLKSTERLVTPDALKTILRAVLDPLEVPWAAAPTHLGLVVEYRVGDNAYLTRETLDLLAHVSAHPHQHPLQLTIERLTIHLAPLVAPRRAESDPHCRRAFVTRARELGHVLWNTLLLQNDATRPLVYSRIPSVVLVECSQSDYRLVGAALSAVAWASPRIEALRCRDICDALQPLDQNLRLAWLVYAIHCHRSTLKSLPLALSLLSTGVLMDEQETTRLVQLLAEGTPLREVVDDALRLRFDDDNSNNEEACLLRVQYLRIGSTVRLANGTRLYYEPARVTDDFVILTLGLCEAELDVVAHVTHGTSDWVGVVYPGYGLVWATAESVVVWQRVDDIEPEGCLETMVSSLALSFDNTYELATPRPHTHRIRAALTLLVFEALESLALELVEVFQNDLVLVLERCPRLHTLTLSRCVVESLAPLADAFSLSPLPHRRPIASLSLLGVRDFRLRDTVLRYGRHPPLKLYHEDGDEKEQGGALALLTPLLDALVIGATHGVLRELHIDLMGLKPPDALVALTQIATAVASPSSTSLTRLHVACTGHALQDACATQLGPLRGVVLADPSRVQCAVLSVLRAYNCGAPGIARVVLALVKESVVRLVTWECVYR